MRTAACVLVMMSACAAIAAQDAANLSFEVASIKPSPPDDGTPRIGIWGTTLPGGRWNSRNATLEKIIRSAYPAHPLPEQLAGGPDWVRSVMFDISAQAPTSTATRDELSTMARNLLAERFKLKVHTEVREVSGYALVLARSDGKPGPGLRPAAVDCAALRDARQRGDAVPTASARACAVMMRSAETTSRLEAGGLALSGLANVLGPSVAAPIVDDTGLTGLFDITLEFATDVGAQASDTPSIFTALPEQLGLRLERRRVPTEVLVIDSVELPTPD